MEATNLPIDTVTRVADSEADKNFGRLQLR